MSTQHRCVIIFHGTKSHNGGLVTNPSDFVSGEEGSIDVEVERRRLRRWFWSLGVLALIGVVGLVRYDYPIVQTASGKKYELTTVAHYLGTGGAWTEVDYLTQSGSVDGKLSEIRDLLPVASQFANEQGDSLIHIGSVERRFQFGLIHFDRRTIVQFYRVGNRWQML